MPVPGGEITGSEIWHTPKQEPLQKFKDIECECDDGCDNCKADE